MVEIATHTAVRPAAAPPRLLLIGHSHLQCVQAAHAQGLAGPAELHVIPLYRDGRVGHEPDFADYIDKQLAAVGGGDFDLVALFIGGNTHNTLGLLAMDPPFDFVLPERPTLPLSPGAQLVPARLVRETLQARMQALLTGLDRLGARFAPRAVCVESPPPIGDDDYVRRYLDEHFRAGFAEGRDIVGAPLRYKLWRTASGIYAARCRAADIPYLSCPETTLVEGMYLRPEGYPRNVTHGNAWFGAQLLAGLLARAQGGATADTR